MEKAAPSIAVAGLAVEIDMAAKASEPRSVRTLELSHKLGRWHDRSILHHSTLGRGVDRRLRTYQQSSSPVETVMVSPRREADYRLLL